MSELTRALADRVAALLAAHPVQDAHPPGYRQAAVLLPLYAAAAGPHLLLTQRTEAVPTHKGQVSLPGGGYREGDADLCATALRETEEEVGLHPEDVRVVGRLDDAITVASRFVVRPFVAVVPSAYAFRPDPREIAALIHLPVAALLRAPFRAEQWVREGRRVPVLVQEYDGHVVWGLTARILQQFVERVARPLAGC
ncbi:MAG: CoA pyrophosphatase [Candidatus Methylomirabilales bacterium]